MGTASKLIHARDAETHRSAEGELTTFLLGAADLGARLSLHESHLPAGTGAPWHVHAHDDEVIYVIEGEVEFGLGDAISVLGPGDLAAAGPGVPRKFRALRDSRLLVMNTPAGPGEGFLRAMQELARVPNESELQDLEARFGVTVPPGLG